MKKVVLFPDFRKGPKNRSIQQDISELGEVDSRSEKRDLLVEFPPGVPLSHSVSRFPGCVLLTVAYTDLSGCR